MDWEFGTGKTARRHGKWKGRKFRIVYIPTQPEVFCHRCLPVKASGWK